jgi:hypothetical protein
MGATLKAFIPRLLSTNNRPSKVQIMANKALTESHRLLIDEQEREAEEEKEMLAAADGALRYFREHSGGVIKNIMDKHAGAKNGVCQVRLVVEEIKQRFSGIPKQVRSLIDEDLNGIVAAKSRTEISAVIELMDKLMGEQREHLAVNADARGRGELLDAMTDQAAVHHFRRRISGRVAALTPLLTWLDEPREVALTWEQVKVRTILFCQSGITAVGEEETEDTGTRETHGAAAAGAAVANQVANVNAARGMMGGDGSGGGGGEGGRTWQRQGSDYRTAGPGKCFLFARDGNCTYGSACRYLHQAQGEELPEAKRARVEGRGEG